MTGDDYGFAIQQHASINLDLIRSVIDKTKIMYFSWSGRIWGSALTFLFTSIEKSLFVKINTLAYLLFILLVYINVIGGFKINFVVLLAINFSMLVFLPCYGQDFLWRTGVANYMYPLMLNLIYLFFYRYYKGQNIYNNYICLFLFFFLSLANGITNENTSIDMIVFTILLMLLEKQSNHKVPIYMWVGLIGTFIGACILLGAPGNFVRATHFHYHLLSNLRTNINALFEYKIMFIPFLTFMLLYVNNENWQDRKEALPYAIVSIIGVLAMTASPVTFGGRNVLSSVVLMVIAAGILYTKLDFDKRTIRNSAVILCIFLVMGSTKLFHQASVQLKNYSQLNQENLRLIERAKEQGKIATIYIIPCNTRFSMLYDNGNMDLQPNKDLNNPVNRSMAAYLGVNGIIAIYK